MQTALYAFALLLLAPAAHAASFHVGTQDGRATAMGMAVSADIADPSATLYNPAGIAQGRNLEIRLGDTLIIPRFRANLAGGSTTVEANPIPPPHLYASYGITEEATVGLGFFIPFGLDVTWPDGWEGRFNSTHSSLRNYYLNPTLAYRFLDRLRVGVGVQVVYSTVKLERQVDLQVTEASLELSGSSWGVGGNAGIQLDILKEKSRFGHLSLGVAYRSPVSLDFDDGEATFSGVPAPLQPVFRNQKVVTSVTLPQILTLGIAWRYAGLRLGVDTEYTGWQSLQELDLDFESPQLDSRVVKRLHHTWNLHVGGEYAVTEMFLVRLGFMYDPTPNPRDTLSPNIPDADRLNFAGGLGFRFSGFAVDAAYQYVHMLDKTSTFPELPGTYDGGVHVIGLTLGYKLGL